MSLNVTIPIHIRGIVFARYRHSGRLHVKAAVQGDYFPHHYESGWEDERDFRVHDIYVNFSGPGYNARIGNQIVRWGNADGFSPLYNVKINYWANLTIDIGVEIVNGDESTLIGTFKDNDQMYVILEYRF